MLSGSVSALELKHQSTGRACEVVNVSLYQLLSKADKLERWIGEKEREIRKIVTVKNIKVVKEVRHHLAYFQVIDANSQRIDNINTLARQMLQEKHPNSEDIVTCQNHINASWAELCARAKVSVLELFPAISPANCTENSIQIL